MELLRPMVSTSAQSNLSQAARAVALAINKLLGSVSLDMDDLDDEPEELSANEILFKSPHTRICFTKNLDVINR